MSGRRGGRSRRQSDADRRRGAGRRVHDLAARREPRPGEEPRPGHVSTDIGNVENKTFTIALVNGTYAYICDARPNMKGTFTVGAVAATTTTTTAKATPKPKPKPKPKKKK